MCGICGAVSFDRTPDVDLVRRMMARLAHRGPDGSGYFRDRLAALGHTRLAIVDTEGGAQPMCNEDGSLWVTFNGEIFNFVELRDELLGLGHAFQTTSDTEVIVHAWEEWGEACLARFNGQWAFALWDRRAERLILSRDRLGVRPLFLVRGSRQVRFASEVKALFADPSLNRSFDPVGLGQTFTFWSPVAPRTAFADVEQLEPGHLAIFDRDGFRKHAYWQIDFPARGNEPCRDLAANAMELRERVIEASRLRFVRSDVPVGAYLSGGIDSSITAAVISKYTPVPVDTFSLRFSDQEFDESRYQVEMATRLGTRHRHIVVTPADIARAFPDVVWHAESPVLRAAPAPMLLLSRLVRDSGYKVVVSGEGADEVLAGYDIFREARVRLFWSRDPGSAKRARAAELLYPWMVRSPAQAPAFARAFFGRNLDAADPAISHRPRWDSTAAIIGLLDPDLKAALGPPAADELLRAMPPGSGDWDPLSRAQWLEMTTLLPGYILSSQGDRMLMANSVEGRFPFLDRDVVQLANALPGHHKLLGLEEKHILKRAFADLVPESILRRPKQPYRAPDAESFFRDEPAWLPEVTDDGAIRASGVFDPVRVAGLFAKCRRSRGTAMSNSDNMRVLAVVSTQLAHRQFVVDAGAGRFDDRLPQPVVVHDLATGGRWNDGG